MLRLLHTKYKMRFRMVLWGKNLKMSDISSTGCVRPISSFLSGTQALWFIYVPPALGVNLHRNPGLSMPKRCPKVRGGSFFGFFWGFFGPFLCHCWARCPFSGDARFFPNRIFVVACLCEAKYLATSPRILPPLVLSGVVARIIHIWHRSGGGSCVLNRGARALRGRLGHWKRAERAAAPRTPTQFPCSPNIGSLSGSCGEGHCPPGQISLPQTPGPRSNPQFFFVWG